MPLMETRASVLPVGPLRPIPIHLSRPVAPCLMERPLPIPLPLNLPLTFHPQSMLPSQQQLQQQQQSRPLCDNLQMRSSPSLSPKGNNNNILTTKPTTSSVTSHDTMASLSSPTPRPPTTAKIWNPALDLNSNTRSYRSRYTEGEGEKEEKMDERSEEEGEEEEYVRGVDEESKQPTAVSQEASTDRRFGNRDCFVSGEDLSNTGSAFTEPSIIPPPLPLPLPASSSSSASSSAAAASSSVSSSPPPPQSSATTVADSSPSAPVSSIAGVTKYETLSSSPSPISSLPISSAVHNMQTLKVQDTRSPLSSPSSLSSLPISSPLSSPLQSKTNTDESLQKINNKINEVYEKTNLELLHKTNSDAKSPSSSSISSKFGNFTTKNNNNNNNNTVINKQQPLSPDVFVKDAPIHASVFSPQKLNPSHQQHPHLYPHHHPPQLSPFTAPPSHLPLPIPLPLPHHPSLHPPSSGNAILERQLFQNALSLAQSRAAILNQQQQQQHHHLQQQQQQQQQQQLHLRQQLQQLQHLHQQQQLRNHNNNNNSDIQSKDIKNNNIPFQKAIPQHQQNAQDPTPQNLLQLKHHHHHQPQSKMDSHTLIASSTPDKLSLHSPQPPPPNHPSQQPNSDNRLHLTLHNALALAQSRAAMIGRAPSSIPYNAQFPAVAPLVSMDTAASHGYGRKLFPCPQCRYTTDRRNNLKRHMLTMHQTSSKMLECCGILFNTKAALREHAMIFHYHGYTCYFCGRRFCRKALLKRHLSVHNGQKDFVCTVCDYATSHKSNLERHRKVHSRQDDDGKDEDVGNTDDRSDRHHHHHHQHHHHQHHHHGMVGVGGYHDDMKSSGSEAMSHDDVITDDDDELLSVCSDFDDDDDDTDVEINVHSD